VRIRVGPVRRWARGAPVEHSELVTQDQDFDLLAGLGSSSQHDPAQERREHLVDQPQCHRRIMPGLRRQRSSRSGDVNRVSGIHKRNSPSLTVYDESNPVIGCVVGADGDVLRVVRARGAVPVRLPPFEESLVLAAKVVSGVL
jgi:hypothetical protein